ncbi:MAG: MarR family transcriptional regulator [Pseudonocardiaceae bacterium]
MRVGDWPFRQVPPTHLGFQDYPRSARVYRLCLRPHVPPTPSAGWDPVTSPLRTRVPGGIAVLDIRGAEVSFVAAGTVYEATEPLVRILGRIHAADGISALDVAEATGIPKSSCIPVIDELLTQGLVRI